MRNLASLIANVFAWRNKLRNIERDVSYVGESDEKKELYSQEREKRELLIMEGANIPLALPIRGLDIDAINKISVTAIELAEVLTPRISGDVFYSHYNTKTNTDYIYRIDYYDSNKVGRISLSDVKIIGHRFANNLDNFYPIFANSTILIDGIIKRIADMSNGRTPRGLYFYLNLRDAVKFQYECHYQISLSRDIDGFRSTIPILTRMRLGSLPDGVTFPDPLTLSGASAGLHVVCQPPDISTPAVIRPEEIELWFDGDWRLLNHARAYETGLHVLDHARLENDMQNFDIRNVLFPIDLLSGAKK